MIARKMAATAMLLTMLLFMSFVRADTLVVEDPAEGYPIDVTSADHRHPRVAPASLVAHTFRASEEWSTEEMPRARLKLRLIGTDRPRLRFVELRPNSDGSLRGVLTSPKKLLGHVYAWRPDASTLRIEIARPLLDGARAYRWSARVYQPCPQDAETCAIESDRVPDQGAILHPIKR